MKRWTEASVLKLDNHFLEAPLSIRVPTYSSLSSRLASTEFTPSTQNSYHSSVWIKTYLLPIYRPKAMSKRSNYVLVDISSQCGVCTWTRGIEELRAIFSWQFYGLVWNQTRSRGLIYFCFSFSFLFSECRNLILRQSYQKIPEEKISKALIFPVGTNNPNELKHDLNKIKYLN